MPNNNVQKFALVTTGVVVAGLVLTIGAVVAVGSLIAAPFIALLRNKRLAHAEQPQQPAPKDVIDVSFERLDK